MKGSHFSHNKWLQNSGNMNNISNKRTKAIKKNIGLMTLFKGASLLISFLYVPLLYNALDTTSYGVWLTLTSLVSWVAMFDIGLGNGLRNKLAESLALEDHVSAKKYVSTAYVYIVILITFLILIFFAIRSFIPWSRILNASEIDQTSLYSLVAIVFISFCIRFALNLINSIMLALQQPAMSAGLALSEQFMSFGIVFILVKVYDITSLLILGTVISITPILVLLIISAVLFITKYQHIAPSISHCEVSKAKSILSLGIRFFIVQIGTIILFQSNNLIITQVIGNDAVVQYNIVYKYMHILVMAFNIIATPFWSATTDAYVRGDFEWIKSANRKIKQIALGLAIVGFVMLLCSQWFYKFWLGDNSVEIPMTTSILLYCYMVIMMLYGCYGYFVNGFGHLYIQIIVTIALSILYPILAVVAGNVFGINGILTIFILATLANYLWSKIQYTKIVNHTAKGIWVK